MNTKKTLIEAKVTHVSDGDTLKADCNGLSITVRLDSIDAPEKAQPYGEEAKLALTALVLHKDVKIEQTAKDRYGRIVGKVFRGRTYVNEEMIKNGHAWFYVQYANEPEFQKLSEKAQHAKLGLWALPKAKRIPPWEWRKQKQEKSEAIQSAKASGTKRTWLPLTLAIIALAAVAGVAYLWITGKLTL
ncbi:thermonuclease family protein [Beggiatoa leptomitoformis]|uniref:Nuclease n=1 Tax=Beggiatoa leptomitoformis TaxID=288004 RepID=A0A650GD26_9GAMM|nr:thermonuclease family protein [Beggiatoa leptomitoformis]QGX03526.1 nuclease [Beggiatoa leptomitoformis]QGX04043.1 nuclease [Beggiatoa leptomitoformis]